MFKGYASDDDDPVEPSVVARGPLEPVTRAADAAQQTLRPARSNFGPKTWATLEDFVESMPEAPTQTQQEALLKILEGMRELVPCVECQWHFGFYLDHRPLPRPFTREQASTWLWRLHNAVNRRTGKTTILKSEQRLCWERRARQPVCRVSYEDELGTPHGFKNASGRVATYEFRPWEDRNNDLYRVLRRPDVMASWIWFTVEKLVLAVMVLVLVFRSVRRQAEIHRRFHLPATKQKMQKAARKSTWVKRLVYGLK